jgi:hypothetical protein
MSHSQPLLSSQIEADEDTPSRSNNTPLGNMNTSSSGLPAPVTQSNQNNGSSGGSEEEGLAGMLKRSSHPVCVFLTSLTAAEREVG